ncbi:MAG: alpha/beta hydrolase [Gemmataceae bacterium]
MPRLLALVLLASPALVHAQEPIVIDLWPGKAPGEAKELPPEINLTKPDDKPVGDRPIIKLTNVSRPTLSVYQPAGKSTGAAVIVCPGGGHNILAFDHEGTEVAQMLVKHGVVGIVLKYRVPARNPAKRWIAAVQDAQRAVRLVRARAGDWNIDPKRVGILGFSAGGETAGLTAIFSERQYPTVDKLDDTSSRPDFAALIYPGGLLDKIEKGSPAKLRDYVRPTKDTPPMFFAHAFNDPVDVRNSLLLANELKALGVSCEMHLYATGGHGYGMRNTGHACNTWPDRFLDWMRGQGYLSAK